jgi:hypothetical protein
MVQARPGPLFLRSVVFRPRGIGKAPAGSYNTSNSATQVQQVIYSVSGLANTTHTLQVVKTGGSYLIAVIDQWTCNGQSNQESKASSSISGPARTSPAPTRTSSPSLSYKEVQDTEQLLPRSRISASMKLVTPSGTHAVRRLPRSDQARRVTMRTHDPQGMRSWVLGGLDG